MVLHSTQCALRGEGFVEFVPSVSGRLFVLIFQITECLEEWRTLRDSAISDGRKIRGAFNRSDGLL